MVKFLNTALLLLLLVFIYTPPVFSSSDSLSAYNSRSAAQKLSRDGIMPLTWSKYELNKISDIAGGSFYYGNEASESRFKKEVNNFGILHIASHTVINDENPDLTHISFSSDDELDDGQLNVYEIYNQKMNAGMIILSSCNTGLGKIITGEGALSLARAFMYAGSPSIVMSLWDIDDRATSEIVISFYKNMLDGKTKDESLRAAKLKYLEDADQYTANPLYWGGLVTIGDQSNISIEKNSVNWGLPLGILLSLSLIVSVLFYSRSKLFIRN